MCLLKLGGMYVEDCSRTLAGVLESLIRHFSYLEPWTFRDLRKRGFLVCSVELIFFSNGHCCAARRGGL